MASLFLSRSSFVILLILGSVFTQEEDPFLYDTFPPNFQWGFATASYQIEGAWNVDGKGPNIWDVFTHPPFENGVSPIVDNSTGDIACNSYHMYREDVELLKNMGADYYRFSLSWSRILPTGRTDVINQLGIDYYNRLINLLIENNIEPMITLYHWDLPQSMQELGGWPNETVVQHFEAYADVAFRSFGDRVKKWITFNEPWVTCINGYSVGVMAPGIKDINQPYWCVHNIIKSHAKAYRLYEKNYKPTQQGRVGITLDVGWYEPADPSNAAHVSAAERTLLFKGWFGYPIFFGYYPPIMELYCNQSGIAEGVPSRLPVWTAAESEEIKGTWDFLGLNHYTTELAENDPNNHEPGWHGDQKTKTYHDPEWPESAASWLRTVPWGFRKLLNWLKDHYNNPEIFVTENGFADYPETGLNDTGRMYYYNNYINQMLKAVTVDLVNCTSYTAWSLMDNFEWARGYTERFGVHSVDFTDPARPRTPKESAKLLKQIFADNGFLEP